MRLISAHVRGYGRLVNTKVNLDSKVIAVVGPNEAGKTTLLKALAHVDTGEEVPVAQRSRAGDVPDEARITTFHYILDDGDRKALADLDLAKQPTSAKVARNAAGSKLTVDISPKPVKSVAQLEQALPVLEAGFASPSSLEAWVDPETVYSDPDSDAPRDYLRELQVVIQAAAQVIAEPGAKLEDESIELAESLRDATLEGAEIRNALSTVAAWGRQEEPSAEARDRIWKRSPDFILFDEEDRSIQSSYTFDAALVSDTPDALANLAGTAGLDLQELHGFVTTGDVARRRTAIVQANRRMDTTFNEAWKQSRLSVHFEVDGDQLRIELMEDGDNVTVFDERSAGLRMFVALIAFLKVHGSARPPILLIDEAENHLHIDAQADLVNMFVTQEHAVKVIYTTHSPACLPPDLGTGIRTVVPRKDNYQISDIQNSFWQGAAGYTPLMVAMGAAAAAFTPARSVVLAEGATEMILLPTLLRSATGLSELPYQVAPGLSEVPKDFMPHLDLEGSRVAYLVDGDSGGKAIKKLLASAGVPKEMVVEIDVPGIENVLDINAYRDAVRTLLHECNPTTQHESLPELPAFDSRKTTSIALEMEGWIEQQGLKAPSKVAVASWLVQNERATASPGHTQVLVDVHARLLRALEVGNEQIAYKRTNALTEALIDD